MEKIREGDPFQKIKMIREGERGVKSGEREKWPCESVMGNFSFSPINQCSSQLMGPLFIEEKKRPRKGKDYLNPIANSILQKR
jgi:hypothetical protein